MAIDSGHMQAMFSPCRSYRYTLWRQWTPLLLGGKSGYVMWIGLNPSTGDEITDDPTIRRCMGFARSWGYSAMCMTNLFAYRATDPKQMMLIDVPVGPENNSVLKKTAREASLIVAAWGNHGSHRKRGSTVVGMIEQPMHALAITNRGFPCHPLYLPKTCTPRSFWG
jgi:hypothetical protein